jgi:hydrogenase nickel incorporation protein HypA/HybF
MIYLMPVRKKRRAALHELSVTQNILEIALRHAQEAGAVRIREINLVIGELSSIVDDSVQFYWDIISEGTMAQGAVLRFERIPATLRCRECALSRDDYACPACGSFAVGVGGGDEFYLESIEVDLAQPQPGQVAPG